jgi:tetratricopeptide (TPR) repeat protein
MHIHKIIAIAAVFWLGIVTVIAIIPSTRDAATAIFQPDFMDRVSAWYDEAVGDLLAAGNNNEGAVESYREAQLALDRILTIKSKDQKYMENLATLLIKIGDSAWQENNMGDSLKAYQSSMAIRQELVNMNPTTLYSRSALSISQERLANALHTNRELEEAGKLFELNLALRQKLNAEFPGELYLQEYLIDSYRHLGSLEETKGNVAAALTHYREAIAITDRLPNKTPINKDWHQNIDTVRDKITALESRSKD